MIKLDSVKLLLEEDAIKEFDKTKFTALRESKFVESIFDLGKEKEIITKTTYKLGSEHIPFGVKSMRVERHRDKPTQVIVELSAKALKDKYYELINKNNIGYLLSNLQTKPLRLNYETAKVLKIDVTDNVRVPAKVSNYINALQFYSINPKYDMKAYNNTGITFIKDNKTPYLRDRVIVYDKIEEIKRDKELCKFVNPLEFSNILRFESNLRHFKQTQRRLGSDNLNLISVLHSQAKVNYEIINDITSRYNPIDLFSKYEGKKLNEIEKLEGRYAIIRACNFDMKLIRKFIREKLSKKTNPSYQYKIYRNLIVEMQAKKQDIHINYVNELKELLRVA